MNSVPPKPVKRSRSVQTVRQKFADLERQVRSTVCITGISRIVTVVFGGLILCGFTDWVLQLDDPGLRFLLGIGLAGSLGWTAWRWLWSPLTEPRNSSLLAMQLERQRPHLGSQLVSATEFLQQELSPRLGSPRLQQAVIEQAEQRLDSIDLDGVIDHRDVRNHSLLAALASAAALALVMLFPTESATAVTRLLLPLSHVPWPHRVQLQLVEHDLVPWPTTTVVPRRMVQGDTLELYVRNLKGALPDDVQLEYRIGEDRLVREPLRRTILRDEQGHPVDVAGINLPIAHGPIRLRAVGGDDDTMGFFSVEVVLPPEIFALQVRLEPPVYTGRDAEALPPGTGDIQALAGTKVNLKATSTQPLSEASILVSNGNRLPLTLTDDALRFEASFVLDDPKVTGYRFELINVDGFTSPERALQYSIRLTQDLAPQVVLEEPSSDLTATADAELPLQAAVKDDFGLQEIRLGFVSDRNSEAQSQRINVYQPSVTDDHLTYVWQLAELNLSAGDRLQFHLEATDNFDLGPANVGRSAVRTVTIVGADEKRDELTNRLSELLSDLSEGITVQRRIAEQTADLSERLRSQAEVQPADADLLRKLDLEQQRVLHQLLEPGSSVRANSERLLEEFTANHLDNSEATERLENLAATLTELGRETLPGLKQQMTQAQKGASVPAPGRAEQLAKELSALQRDQQRTLDTLDQLEAGLSGWRDRRHVAQQLDGLVENQRDLNRRTRSLTEDQLQRQGTDSKDADRTSLQKLAQRQRSQAEAVDQFRKHLEQMQDSQGSQDPQLGTQLKDLAEELARSGVSAQLREAASSLSEGRPGEASQQQEEGLHKLEELENLLENRPPDDQEMLVKQMKALEQQLETLQRSQDELSKKFAGAEPGAEGEEPTEELQQLMKQEQELSEELAEIERQLERLQLKAPRQAARRARQQMQRLAGKPHSRTDQQEALQETLDDLEQARRELAQEREQAEEELAYEQLLKLADELQGLAARQASLREEVLRLDAVQKEKGTLSRGQLKTLLQTAESEREISQAIQALAKKLSEVEILTLTLQRITQRMELVAQGLEQKLTDDTVQIPLSSIQQQLERLLSVLNSSSGQTDQAAEQGEPSEAETPQSNGPPGDVITLITQLELLKDLQQDCAERTADLEKSRQPTEKFTPAQQAELESLRQDQEQLTNLARNLLSRLLARPSPPPAGSSPSEPPAP